MAAADETDVVAVVGAGPRLARATLECWDQGRAILPINPAFTGAEVATLLERLRPTLVADADSAAATVWRGGRPARAGTAAIVVTSGTEGTPKGVELTRAGMEVMGR
ncbi:MAG TPA: hypothetical protein VIK54_15640, partial [Acidimicrobiia bacterium]